MPSDALSFELECICKGLFVRTHKAGKLLEAGCVSTFTTFPSRGAIGADSLLTLTNNSPSSESIFTENKALG